MIESKDITKMIQHIIRRDNGVADTKIMHPTREWFLGIILMIVVTIGGAWFSFVQYETYVEKRDAPVAVVESSVSFQAAKVSTALSTYRAKRALYESAIGTDESNTPSTGTSSPQVESDSPVSTPKPPQTIVLPIVATSTATDSADKEIVGDDVSQQEATTSELDTTVRMAL